MQSDPMAVLGLILISFEVFNLTTFLHNLPGKPTSQTFLYKCVRKVGKRAKERNEGERGRGRKDTLDRKPHDSEKKY